MYFVLACDLIHPRALQRHSALVDASVREQVHAAFATQPFQRATVNGVPLQTLVRVLGNETFLTEDDVDAILFGFRQINQGSA